MPTCGNLIWWDAVLVYHTHTHTFKASVMALVLKTRLSKRAHSFGFKK